MCHKPSCQRLLQCGRKVVIVTSLLQLTVIFAIFVRTFPSTFINVSSWHNPKSLVLSALLYGLGIFKSAISRWIKGYFLTLNSINLGHMLVRL